MNIENTSTSTPLSIENMKSNHLYSIKPSHETDGLNNKNCKKTTIDDSIDMNCCFPSRKKNNLYSPDVYKDISVYTPPITRTPSPEVDIATEIETAQIGDNAHKHSNNVSGLNSNMCNNIDCNNVNTDIIMFDNLKKINNEYVLSNGYIVSINNKLIYIIPTEYFILNNPIFIYYLFNEYPRPRYGYFNVFNNLIDIALAL